MSEIHEQEAVRPATEYQERLEAGEISFQRCTGCQRAIFFPRVMCPVCGSPSLEWEASAGRGVVYSATTIPVRDGEPYVVALVDFEEGFRAMVRYVGDAASQDIIGSAVTASVGRLGEEPALIARAEQGAT